MCSHFGLVHHSSACWPRLQENRELYQPYKHKWPGQFCSLFALLNCSSSLHSSHPAFRVAEARSSLKNWSKNDQMGCARLSLSFASLLPVGHVLLLETLDQLLAGQTWPRTFGQGVPRASPGGFKLTFATNHAFFTAKLCMVNIHWAKRPPLLIKSYKFCPDSACPSRRISSTRKLFLDGSYYI